MISAGETFLKRKVLPRTPFQRILGFCGGLNQRFTPPQKGIPNCYGKGIAASSSHPSLKTFRRSEISDFRTPMMKVFRKGVRGKALFSKRVAPAKNYFRKTISPPTIVITTLPVSSRPMKGEFCDFERKSLGSTFQRASGSKTVISA